MVLITGVAKGRDPGITTAFISLCTRKGLKKMSLQEELWCWHTPPQEAICRYTTPLCKRRGRKRWTWATISAQTHGCIDFLCQLMPAKNTSPETTQQELQAKLPCLRLPLQPYDIDPPYLLLFLLLKSHSRKNPQCDFLTLAVLLRECLSVSASQINPLSCYLSVWFCSL